MNMILNIVRCYRGIVKILNLAAPAADLTVRLVVARVFWYAGLSKAASMSSTVALFEYVYHVPLLPPVVAAWTGMLVEVVFSVLLATGTATRFSAFVLSVFNVIAVISYPELSDAGRGLHFLWGVLLLVPLFHGPGTLSIDHAVSVWLRRRGAGLGAALERR